MILQTNDVLSVSYKPTDQNATGMLKCEIAYIKQSQTPECLFIRKWEETKINPHQSLTNKSISLGWRWTIRLKDYSLTFKTERFAYEMFHLLLTEFQDTDIKKKFPEYYL